jgi:hypothetical protein
VIKPIVNVFVAPGAVVVGAVVVGAVVVGAVVVGAVVVGAVVVGAVVVGVAWPQPLRINPTTSKINNGIRNNFFTNSSPFWLFCVSHRAGAWSHPFNYIPLHLPGFP